MKLSMGARLGAGFACVLVLTVVLGVFSAYEMRRQEAIAREIAGHWLPAATVLGEMRDLASRIRRREFQHVMARSADERQKYEKEIDGLKVKVATERGAYEKLPLSGAEREAFGEVVRQFDAYYGSGAALFAVSNRGEQAADAARAAINGSDGASRKSFNAVLDRLDEQILKARQGADAAQTQAAQAVRTGVWTTVALMVAAVAVGVALAVTITRSSVRRIRRAERTAQAIAAGDLATAVSDDSGDEIGQLLAALEQMRQRIDAVVGSVRVGAQAVSAAAGQIASGNADLSSRTEQQAAALEQTSSTMTELATTVRHNADSARQAEEVARHSSDVAQRGGESVSRVVDTMRGITESSRRIADIIGVIDGIAFQTNILALNAAVEAARAGEQGRGFAVVASEVRALAQRSANAAREIKALIDDSATRVEAGDRQVAQAGDTIGDVVESIRRMTSIVGEISSAASEQTAGIDQVSQAVESMDSMTQQNASMVEEASAAAQSLNEQARRLVEEVSFFRTSTA